MYKRPIVAFLLVLTAAWPAHAHTGPILVPMVIVGFVQLFAGPACILGADLFKGARLVILILFALAVILSWGLWLSGYMAGLSEASYEALLEGLDVKTQFQIDEALFYINFIGIPALALAGFSVARVLAVRRHADGDAARGQQDG